MSRTWANLRPKQRKAILACDLRCTQHGERFTQIELSAPGLIEQRVELIADGRQLQSREHGLQVARHFQHRGLGLLGGDQLPAPSERALVFRQGAQQLRGRL